MKFPFAFSNPKKYQYGRKNIELVVKRKSWDEISELLTTVIQGSKYDYYFIRGGWVNYVQSYTSSTGRVYGPGYYRNDHSLKAANLVVIDGDNAVGEKLYSAKFLHEHLADFKYNYCIYTTHSQSKEKNKWRLVVPTNQPFDKGSLGFLVDYICDYLDQVTGIQIKRVKENYSWSQAWYLPTRDDPEDGLFYGVSVSDRKFLDPAEIIPGHKVEIEYETKNGRNTVNLFTANVSYRRHQDSEPTSTEAESRSYSEKIKIILTGSEGLHDATRDLLYKYYKDGMNKYAAIQNIKILMDQVPPEKKDARWRERYNDLERMWDSIAIKEEAADDEFAAEVAENKEENDEYRKILALFDTEIHGLFEDNIEIENLVINRETCSIFSDLIESIGKYSRYPNKAINIVTALGLSAGIIGRRFNVSGTGLNLYLTMLMGTGGGKSWISKYINRLFLEMNSAGLSPVTFIGSRRYTGPKPLLAELSQKRCMLSIFQEAGFLFSSEVGDKAGLTRNILDLYGSSGRYDVMQGESYSEAKSSIPAVRAPAFSMILESTPDVFLQAFKGLDALKTGQLTRMVILKVPEGAAKINREANFVIGNDVIKTIRYLANFAMKTHNLDDPLPIEFEVEDYHYDFLDRCKILASELYNDNPVVSMLLTRVGMNVLKIACIISAYEHVYEKGLDTAALNSIADSGETLNITRKSWLFAQAIIAAELLDIESLVNNNWDEIQMSVVTVLADLFNGKRKYGYKLTPSQIAKKAVPLYLIRKVISKRLQYTMPKSLQYQVDPAGAVIQSFEKSGLLKVTEKTHNFGTKKACQHVVITDLFWPEIYLAMQAK